MTCGLFHGSALSAALGTCILLVSLLATGSSRLKRWHQMFLAIANQICAAQLFQGFA
jgi:hypothetical protein